MLWVPPATVDSTAHRTFELGVTYYFFNVSRTIIIPRDYNPVTIKTREGVYSFIIWGVSGSMGPPSVAPPLAGEPHSNIGEVPELPTSGGVLQFARDAIWSHMESLKQRLQEEFNAVHVDISSVRARRQLLGEQLYNHQKINIDLHQRINSAEQELQELKSKKAEVETRLASARRAVISERQVTEKKKERVTALEKDLCKLSGDLVTAKNEHESEVTDVAATRRAAYVADAMAAQHRRDGRRMHELIDVFKSRLEILVLTKEAMIEQKKALAMEKATFDANVAVVHAQQKTASNDVKTLKKRWRQAVHARGVTDESILRLEDTLNVLRKRTSTARVQYAACMEMTQRIVAAHSQTAERIARAHREEAQAVKRAREADARKGNAEEDSQKLKERRGTLEAASVEIETGLNESRKDINVLQLRIKEIERSGKELDAQCREVLRARRQSTAVGEVAQRQLQQTVALEEEKRMRIDELEKKMKAVHIAMQTESRENEGYLQEMHQARLQLQEEAAALGATQRAVDSAKREIRQRSHTMEMMGRQMRKYEEDPLNKTGEWVQRKGPVAAWSLLEMQQATNRILK